MGILNTHDKKLLGKRMQNPEFSALFTELVSIHFAIQALIVNNQQGESIEEATATGVVLAHSADSLARELSTFFPANRRDYWQEIFIKLTFSRGAIMQPPLVEGRSPQSGLSSKKAEEYEKMATDFWKSGETEMLYCYVNKISRGKLQRAIDYMLQRIDD